MPERGSYQHGVPSWVDLTTSDAEAAREFYGRLFGWEWEISQEPEFGGYAQATVRGKRVAGLGQRPDESMPVVWTTYLAVDDVDKTAQAVSEHGGTVVMPTMAIADQGRMAIASDPTGAVFGMWEAGSHKGAQLVNEHGALNWNEVVTPDLDAATQFYSNVFGVTWQDMGSPEGPYKTFHVGDRAVGGAMPPQPGTEHLPPHWNTYFLVDDVNATIERARELGAQVLSDVIQTPQGPMAAIADPQGGIFYAIQFNGEVD